jgi:hypothetical protein
MTDETHSVQAPLSTDLEALRTRVKDQSLTLGELKQALKTLGDVDRETHVFGLARVPRLNLVAR